MTAADFANTKSLFRDGHPLGCSPGHPILLKFSNAFRETKQNRHLIVSPYTHLTLTLPIILIWHYVITGFPRGTSGKEASCQCRRHETCTGSLGWEAPLEKETATPSREILENPTDRGTRQATVHGGHKESDMTEASQHTCDYT